MQLQELLSPSDFIVPFEPADKWDAIAQLMQHLVVAGRYLAVTSELDAGPEIRSGQVRFIPITDPFIFRQRFAVISNVRMPESMANQKIISLTVQTLRTLTASTSAVQ